MTKFTKGPWYVSGEGFDLEPMVVGTPHYPIAKVSHVGDLGTQANAALIAASPELYEALELALAPMAHVPDSMLASCNEGSRIPALGQYSPSEVIQMRAALAKAEGK